MKKRRLRIGVIVDQLLAGGVQLAAIEQVKQLNKLGHEATLLILMRKKYTTDFSYLVHGVPHAYLSDHYPKFLRRSFKFPFFSFLSTLHILSPFLAPRVISKNEYDIFLSWGTTTCLTTQAIFRTTSIPYIAIIHDPIEYILDTVYTHTSLRNLFFCIKPLARHLEGSFVHDAAHTFIISKVHETYMVNHYGIKPLLLYFGTEALKKIPDARGDTILSFGRWQMEKHPELLLALAKKIPNVRIVIAGTWINSETRNAFQKQIENMKLTHRVYVVGHFTKTELRHLCQEARLFVHPHFEAFGLAALEAAAHGLPIIIPARSGVTEYFTDGEHGYFPKKVTVDDFKKPIETLLRNKKKSFEMGKAGWEIVKKEFSWEANTKKLLTVLETTQNEIKKTEMVVLETGHALGIQLSGGDKLLEPMISKLTEDFRFSVIVPQIGIAHWLGNPVHKKLMIIPKNPFDNQGRPIPVFLTYCIRMVKSTWLLLTQKSPNQIIYSSTNLLPDILPAFVCSLMRKNTWIARVHHLIPLPHKREGIWVVNVVAYLMQLISLAMIKSRADLIIVLNEKLKSELKEKDFPAQKLSVLGAGIDYQTIATTPLDLKTVQYQSIYVGRLHPSKGIFDLVPIWKQVIKQNPKAKLAIIGTGDIHYEKLLIKMIHQEKLEKNIILLGHISNDHLYRLLKRAQVFLFTDHEAGWGIAVAEAMAAGLPIVGYDIGVLGTVFKKGYLEVPLSDINALAVKINTLLSDEKKRIKLALAAENEAKHFDWKETSTKFHTLLSRITQPKKSELMYFVSKT